jgi:tetrahydromethanopterin S-methyltransferase subunit E
MIPGMTSDEELRVKARKIAQDKASVYVHLVVYICVNEFLWIIWATMGQGFPWPLIIMFAWGIGLGAHIAGVFWGSAAVDSMTEKEFQKLKGNR